MKKYILSLCSLLFISMSLCAQYAESMESANKLYSGGLFKQAVTEYQPFLNAKDNATRYEAQLKTALSYIYSYQYDAGLKAIYSYEVPKDDLWKARYYMVKITALQNQARYTATDLIESETDPTKFTYNQRQDAIKESYTSLWNMRKKLVEYPTTDSLPYFTRYYKNYNSIVTTPTFYDYLVNQWRGNLDIPWEKILEESYSLKGKDRATARELWHIERMLLVYQESYNLPKEKLFTLAQNLAYTAGQTNSVEEKSPYLFKANEVMSKAKAASFAAEYYKAAEEYLKTYETAEYCLSLPLNFYTDSCKNVKDNLSKETFSINEKPDFNTPLDADAKIKITTANIETIYLNIYRLAPEYFADNYDEAFYKVFHDRDMKKRMTPENKRLFEKLLAQGGWTTSPGWRAREAIANDLIPLRTIELALTYKEKYAPAQTDIPVPYIRPGLYAVVLSKTKTPSETDQMVFLNFTDIAGAATAFAVTNDIAKTPFKGNAFNVYTLHPKTGEPRADIKITSKTNQTSPKSGVVRFSSKLDLKNDSLNALLQKGDSYAIIDNVYFSLNETPRYQIILNSDRSIYRPGQEVKIKANVVEYKAPNYTVYSGKEKITLTLRDSQNKKIESVDLPLSKMGSTEYTFTIPQNAMLGTFRLAAYIEKQNATKYIDVEEYKRPEFEVNLKESTGVSLYGKNLNLTGNAAYYHGAPVANAKIKYSISKSYFTPWFCWWWRPITQNRQDRIEGEAKTDKNGNFKINFTPKEDKNLGKEFKGRPSRYTLEVYVTDDGGRSIRADRTYTVSGQEYFFAMKMEKGFFRHNTDKNSIAVTMVNADEKPLTGAALAEIYSAKIDTSKKAEGFMPLAKIAVPGGQAFPQVTEDKLLASFTVNFREEGPQQVDLPSLKEGYYILKMNAKSSSGNNDEGKLVFMVVNPQRPAIDLPEEVTIAENDTYYPGEMATFLIGSSKTKGPKYVEIYKNQFLVETIKIPRPGPALVEFPVSNEHAGGLSMNWFSVYDYKINSGSSSVKVPYANTKLTLDIKIPEFFEPGAEVSANITAKDEEGKPVEGEVLLTVYDKSLDYYAPHNLELPSVYPSQRSTYNPMSDSFSNSLYYGGPVRVMAMSAAGRGVAMESASMEDSSFSLNSVATKAMARSAAPMAMAKQASYDQATAEAETGGADLGGVTLRENFAETAFWAPRLNLENGQADILFTVPERLTQWSMLAAAITKDVKTGQSTAVFTTKKDLMIRLETPRFLREHDKIQLRAILNNGTDAPMPAEVTLTVKLDGQDAAAALGIKETVKKVTIKPGEQTFVTWPIEVPATPGELAFTAVVRASGLSDGEVKELPLLPSVQRLTQSAIVSLEQGTVEVSLDSLADNKDASLEAVHLQVDSSIIMPVVNAIPLITYSKYETVSTLVNTYLPLAIMNNLYNKYPDISQAVANLPKRTTVTPAWDTKEDMLITELSASPWYNLSKGYQTEMNTIDIFNPSLVARMEKETLDKLGQYQNSDGGYTWKKGGQSSEYITLLVLENMAQARSYGIKIPEASVKKALAYTVKKIEINTKDDSYENISTAMYMAYVLSAFPNNWHNFNVKNFIEKAAQYSDYMTPLGKTYAAVVYNRLGDKAKSKQYLDRLFDTATVSETNGMFWAPEERSWMWFNDSLTLHTAAIKALVEINPNDERIPKLVKWLMFKKKATMWGNSEAAAKAVYTLLDVIKKTTDLSQSKVYTANWAGEETKIEVKPFDISGKVTLSKYAPEATANSLKAAVTKQADESGKPSLMPDFVSLTALFTTRKAAQPKEGMLNIYKEFYLVKDKALKLLKDGDTVNVGDEIQVRLTVKTGNRFDYVLIEDAKPAAFEADTLLSGWKYDRLGRYEEVRDNKTNFFMDRLPHGTYELKYTLRPTTAGTYTVGAAVMQSMFAPEFATHSAGFIINVK